MRFKLSSVFIAVVAAAGCVGDIEDPVTPAPDADPGPDPQGKMGPGLYKTTVHTIMAKCQGAGCHSIDANGSALSKFYTADATAAYEQVILETTLTGSFGSTAPIISKMTGTPAHFTVYTAPEITTIQTWLAAETADRVGEPEPEPIDPLSALRTWSGCMELADFNAAGMAQAWGRMAGTNPNKSCTNCHDGGLGRFIASLDEERFFLGITTQSELLRAYFTTGAADAVVINTGSFTNAGTDGGIIGHPRFDPLVNPGMVALQEFYDLTLARKAAALCGPPKLIN